MVARAEPGLVTFAVRVASLDDYALGAGRVGLGVGEVVRMGRTRADGVRLDWSLRFVDDAALGGMVPFAIDWGASPHPSASTPGGCRLRRFVALHPKVERLAAVYAALGVTVEVCAAVRAGFVADLETGLGGESCFLL